MWRIFKENNKPHSNFASITFQICRVTKFPTTKKAAVAAEKIFLSSAPSIKVFLWINERERNESGFVYTEKKAQLSSDSNALHISFFPLQISYFFWFVCLCVGENVWAREWACSRRRVGIFSSLYSHFLHWKAKKSRAEYKKEEEKIKNLIHKNSTKKCM